MPDGSLGAEEFEDGLNSSNFSIVELGCRKPDDLGNTALRSREVQREMNALRYTHEEIADFLSDPDNFSFVIEFCAATRKRIRTDVVGASAFN